ELGREQPTDPNVGARLAHAKLCLALALTAGGRYAEAEAPARQAALAFERAGAAPAGATYRRFAGSAANPPGPAPPRARRRREAELAYRSAGRHWEQLVRLPGREPAADKEWVAFLISCPSPAVRDLPRAVREARELVRQNDKDHDCRRVLGIAQYRTGDWPGAVQSLEGAVGAGSRAADVRLFLALACARLGRTEEARAHYANAVEAARALRSPSEDVKELSAEAAARLGLPDPLAAAAPR